MFSTVKIWLSALAVGAFSVLLIAVRVLSTKNAKLKIDNKIAVAKEKHTRRVLEQDILIDEQTDTHLAEVAKEVEEGKHPSELTDPNDEW